MDEVEACFICGLVSNDPAFAHPVAYRDAVCVVFLSRFPWAFGHVLVAPAMHRERLLAGFSMSEYAALQRVVYATGRALGEYVDAVGLRVSAVEGGEGCRHAHWNVVPGAGVAAEPGVVDVGASRDLAARLRPRISWLLAAGGAFGG
ncbi:hypothetical protein Afil01_36140 [Actinorhabdospora filicis]|uniref:HIT domain-containing protein n=1 Tax=Actinorhabdospora filicis TaxID=1785913 RepID=A0A9W6SMV0_9ACTN|nr:HIT domain-containing protein [Actinorhabdospora filicis]GLZ78807.1 hypothetical protein Afil01_36140 [Actinorhabdospora filicis]